MPWEIALVNEFWECLPARVDWHRPMCGTTVGRSTRMPTIHPAEMAIYRHERWQFSPALFGLILRSAGLIIYPITRLRMLLRYFMSVGSHNVILTYARVGNTGFRDYITRTINTAHHRSPSTYIANDRLASICNAISHDFSVGTEYHI